MKRIKTGLALAALSLAVLGVTGCANLQPPAQAASPREQVNAVVTMGSMTLTIYNPDTKTVYLWIGDPRPASRRPMRCTEVQLGDTPATAPKGKDCQ